MNCLDQMTSHSPEPEGHLCKTHKTQTLRHTVESAPRRHARGHILCKIRGSETFLLQSVNPAVFFHTDPTCLCRSPWVWASGELWGGLKYVDTQLQRSGVWVSTVWVGWDAFVWFVLTALAPQVQPHKWCPTVIRRDPPGQAQKTYGEWGRHAALPAVCNVQCSTKLETYRATGQLEEYSSKHQAGQTKHMQGTTWSPIRGQNYQ